MANSDMPILVVDDAKFSTKVILRCLESGGYKNIHHVTDASTAINFISRKHISIIIADWLMPGMDGIELTRCIRQIDEKNSRYTYIIMLTAKDGVDDLHMAFDEGIDDFINKSAMQNQLLSRIIAAERIVNTQNRLLNSCNELTVTNQSLNHHIQTLQTLCTIDPLTGLHNAAYAETKLTATLNHTLSRGGASCYVLIALNTKTITPKNTVFNEVIKQISQRIKSLVRPLDEVARISDTEFAIITHQPDIERCHNHSFKRIFDGINQRAINTSMGFQSLTIDMAIVAATAEDLPEAKAMLQQARQCILKAKETQRIEHFHFTPDLAVN